MSLGNKWHNLEHKQNSLSVSLVIMISVHFNETSSITMSCTAIPPLASKLACYAMRNGIGDAEAPMSPS